MTPLRLIVADDHPVTREGLSLLLDAQPDMAVVAQACDGHEAVRHYERYRPDVVVMDVQMPSMNGVEATAQILLTHPAARVVLLTTYDGDEDVYRGLKAGAKGYLLKETPTHELLAAIRTIGQGGKYLTFAAHAALAHRNAGSTLTARESDVLRLVAAGQANKQIAADLGIGEGTVKSHLNSIMSKLGVASRTEAVVEATERGLLRD